MIVAFGLIAMTVGIVIGYSICYVATWARVYQQETSLRGLGNEIAMMMDMGDPVPPEWVRDRLDSMVVKDYR